MSKECLDPTVINKFMNLCLDISVYLSALLSYVLPHKLLRSDLFTNFETNVCATEQDQRSLKVMLECFGVWMKQITPESR